MGFRAHHIVDDRVLCDGMCPIRRLHRRECVDSFDFGVDDEHRGGSDAVHFGDIHLVFGQMEEGENNDADGVELEI